MTFQEMYPSSILTTNERSRYGDDNYSELSTSQQNFRTSLRKGPVVFYGKTHSLNGKPLRHRGRATQTRAPKTSHLPNSQQQNATLPPLSPQQPEQPTILSRSFLPDGDVRFTISAGGGPTGTLQTVSLRELLDFVSLQELQDFENDQFTQAHEAEEEKANPKRNRRCKLGRSGGSIARFVERSAGYGGGVDDAISALQGPLVEHGGARQFRGSRGSSQADSGEGRTSATAGDLKPMSRMGVREGQNAHQNLQQQQDSLIERISRPETWSRNRDKAKDTGYEDSPSGAAQSSSVSILNRFGKNEEEYDDDVAALLLRQFQEGQYFGLSRRQEPLNEVEIISTRNPQPRDVGASEPETQRATSSSVVNHTKKRHLSETLTPPEDGQRSSQTKRAKPESDNVGHDEDSQTFSARLFRPESEDELGVDTHRQSISNHDRRVERILADRIVRIRGQPVRQYHIRWRGCPASQNSWEFEKDLQMADVMLKDYRVDRALKKTRGRSSQKGKAIVIDLTQGDD